MGKKENTTQIETLFGLFFKILMFKKEFDL